jgi:hypothetical protein
MKKYGLFLLASLTLVILCSFTYTTYSSYSSLAQTEQVSLAENENPDCIALVFATANAFNNLATSDNLYEAGLWFSLAWYYFDRWASCI